MNNHCTDFSRTWMVWSAIFPIVVATMASEPLAAQEVRYNRDVLPIFSESCLQCHGFDSGTRQAGLRLDQFEGATRELNSGTRAVVPGETGQSELLRRINATDPDAAMPPRETGRHLTDEQKAILRRWIEQGGKYEKHWSFIPPVRVEVPTVSGIDQPIDRFVRARHVVEKITPAPAADRTTLIRRVTLDLTGLPPTPLEVDAFVHDARSNAYERVVDRLLASEHFGERWARWWLDLAHYADSDGYLQDFLRPSAWRFRQWVVDALNDDLPFDQFTVEQLAGDLLPQATVSQRIATGFLRNTLSNREGGADLEEYRVRQVIDRTVTTSTVWLGLTTGCAECHDHKFDPLSQREFYGLYAIFNDADEVNIDAPLPGEWDEYFDKKQSYARNRATLLTLLDEPLAALQAAWEEKLLWAEANPSGDQRWSRALEVLGLVWGQGLGEGQLEGLMIIKTALAKRTQDQRDRLLDYFLKNGSLVAPEKFQELKLAELAAKLDALAKDVPPIGRAQAMIRPPTPRMTRLHVRGDFRNLGEPIGHGVPAILPPLQEPSRADRLALARWLVAPEHPLTARVTVNRLWQELFGMGLVATSDNFGVRGERPTHPELLDWLALEFTSGGWSIKAILRQIVLTQTYGQSSHARPELAVRDPHNRLLARQNRLRLSAEAVRDTALAAGGLLNLTVGGPSVRPVQPAGIADESYSPPWVADRGTLAHQRGLYTFAQRLSPFVQFANFDLPSTSRACTQRERSNTPLQALNLLNDPAFVEAARGLVTRVWRERRTNATERLEVAFAIAMARFPTAAESARLTDYLARQTEHYVNEAAAARDLAPDSLPGATAAETAAWVSLASVLLNLDEFINRE